MAPKKAKYDEFYIPPGAPVKFRRSRAPSPEPIPFRMADAVMAPAAVYRFRKMPYSGFHKKRVVPYRPRSDPYAYAGSVGVGEFKGEHTDTYCLSLGQQSFVYNVMGATYQPAEATSGQNTNVNACNVLYHVAAAFLRRILKLGYGRHIVHPAEVVAGTSLYHTAPIEGLRFTLANTATLKETGSTLDPTTSVAPIVVDFMTYDIQASGITTKKYLTFYEFANNIARSLLANFAQDKTYEFFEITHVQCLTSDATGIIAGGQYPATIANESIVRIHRVLDVRLWTIRVRTRNIMRVQNQTGAADAGTGSADLDRNDVNPLLCTRMVFKGLPRPADKLRDPSISLDAAVGFDRKPELFTVVGVNDGLLKHKNKLVRNPPPALFDNCYSVEKFTLAPGQIRTFHISEVFSGRINMLIKRASLMQTGGRASAYEHQHLKPLGHSYLLFCQMMMPGAVTGDIPSREITVQYDATFKCGAICTARVRRLPIMLVDGGGHYAPATTAGTVNADLDVAAA